MSERWRIEPEYAINVDPTLGINAGKARYYEVLEGQQLLFPAQGNLAQTELDQRLVIVHLQSPWGRVEPAERPMDWALVLAIHKCDHDPKERSTSAQASGLGVRWRLEIAQRR